MRSRSVSGFSALFRAPNTVQIGVGSPSPSRHLHPTAGIRINFPIDAQTGAASTAAVYFELDPEQHIGRHTHSAEEILFILEGEAEAAVGDERGRLSKEEMAVVPANAPHDLYNVGEGTLRVVGFFSSAAVVTIFEVPLAPLDTKVPPVAGAPLPEA